MSDLTKAQVESIAKNIEGMKFEMFATPNSVESLLEDYNLTGETAALVMMARNATLQAVADSLLETVKQES